MDWANESYVRLYTRETSDDLELSWDAISLWRALLTRFDQSGVIAVRNGWHSVGRLVRMPLERVEVAGDELVRDGRVRVVTGGIFAPNFTAAQTASKSDKLRQRESRERRRADAAAQHGANIDAVTNGHAPSQNVTLCFADPKLSLESDSLSLSHSVTQSDSDSSGQRRQERTDLPEGWEPTAESADLAGRLGLDVQHEVRQFIQHFKAKPEKNADWQARFCKWLGDEVAFRGRRGRPTRKPKPGATRVASGVRDADDDWCDPQAKSAPTGVDNP